MRASIREYSKLLISLLLLSFLCTGCQQTICKLEPNICQIQPPYLVERLPSPFTELTLVERTQDWGKELFLGRAFARQMDLYRALTCFKRALILIPLKNDDRRLEIEYEIFFAYYIANKYQDAIDTFETTHLERATEKFPAFRDLLLMLYDAYYQIDHRDQAIYILSLIKGIDQNLANNLTLETAIIDADFPSIQDAADGHPAQEDITQFLIDYETHTKSVSKAKFLNAVLPGAGYYYVGLKKSALTSFVINALFIGAAYQLFERGYIPAAIIVTSLETGWYFGGINGAGIAANEYNNCLYHRLGADTLNRNVLFPILMIQKGF